MSAATSWLTRDLASLRSDSSQQPIATATITDTRKALRRPRTTKARHIILHSDGVQLFFFVSNRIRPHCRNVGSRRLSGRKLQSRAQSARAILARPRRVCFSLSVNHSRKDSTR